MGLSLSQKEVVLVCKNKYTLNQGEKKRTLYSEKLHGMWKMMMEISSPVNIQLFTQNEVNPTREIDRA